ncbi:MAG: hypothetical protein KGI37_08720 [Alphaproteobacteria bacterium]|nr:hypothetical protein [Alphaproteobacteria bacterium]
MAKVVIKSLMILAVVLGVAACADLDIPEAKSTTGRNPTVAEVPDKDETVRGDGDPAIVTLDLDSTLHEHRLSDNQQLPGNIIIPTTNLNAVPITAALQAVLAGTDVSLSWNTGALGSRLVTVMNLSGPLPQVVEKICDAAEVFCDYRHGSINLSEKETFVVALPPVAKIASASTASTSSSSNSSSNSGSSSSSGSSGAATFSDAGSNSMVEAINSLIGEGKAQVDQQGGDIVYTTTVDGEDRVSQYLSQLRTGRPLVVLQMYIWEVTLNSENAEGINWSQLSNSTITKGLTLSGASQLDSLASTTGSMSLGAVTSGIISANAVASFLATKGRVQTISNPQITFVSGTSAQLKVGGTINYISQVGTLLASNVSGTSSGNNSNTSNNTVSTSSIDTGLTINVAGSYENDVVFANLGIALKNLVSLNPTSSSGGTIDLPQTSDETMNTVLRVRPGDSLLLAGLVASSDTDAGQGLPVGDATVPMYGDNQRQNRELVIIVRPSIVLFSDKKASEEAQKKQNAEPLPDAVVIDARGAHKLALPQARAIPVAAASAAPQSLSPELMASEPNAAPVPEPPASGGDQAPVDQQLMQRGFSRAYNQLLKPDGTPADGGSP